MKEVVEEEGDESREGYKRVQLGPKEFEIPEEWAVSTLGELCEIVNGGTPQKKRDEYWGGNIVWVTPTDLTEDVHKYIDDSKDKITSEGLDSSSATLLEPGAVLMSSRATIGEVALNTVPAATNQGFKSLVTKGDVEAEYLYYFIPLIKDYLNEIGGGSTFSEISKADTESIRIPVPPLSEQRRISGVLSTVDEEFRQTEEIIETAEELKQGLEQDLVIGRGLADEYREINLGPRTVEVPTEWKRSTFDNIATIEKGNTPKTSNDDYYGGDIVWVTPDDLSTLYEEGDGKYIDDSRRKLTREGLESTSVDIVEPNSVMFTSRSYGIGKTAICTVPAATNQGIIAFRPNSEMSPEYLYHYLNWIMDYIISLSGVSTFPEVSKSDVANISVPVPTPEHQERITEVLRQADEKIAREQERKQKLQELKRGLMQDLLTGQVRTPPDLLE